jgi:hypothetical protein
MSDNTFIAVPRWVYEMLPPLLPQELAVYIALLASGDYKKDPWIESYPGFRNLKTMTRLGQEQIIKALEELEFRNLIRLHDPGAGRRASVYLVRTRYNSVPTMGTQNENLAYPISDVAYPKPGICVPAVSTPLDIQDITPKKKSLSKSCGSTHWGGDSLKPINSILDDIAKNLGLGDRQ